MRSIIIIIFATLTFGCAATQSIEEKLEACNATGGNCEMEQLHFEKWLERQKRVDAMKAASKECADRGQGYALIYNNTTPRACANKARRCDYFCGKLGRHPFDTQ